MAQINGMLGKTLKIYTRPALLLLDELVYLPIDKRAADLLIDRPMHHGEAIVIQGKSYRMRDKDSDPDSP